MKKKKRKNVYLEDKDNERTIVLHGPNKRTIVETLI